MAAADAIFNPYIHAIVANPSYTKAEADARFQPPGRYVQYVNSIITYHARQGCEGFYVGETDLLCDKAQCRRVEGG